MSDESNSTEDEPQGELVGPTGSLAELNDLIPGAIELMNTHHKNQSETNAALQMERQEAREQHQRHITRVFWAVCIFAAAGVGIVTFKFNDSALFSQLIFAALGYIAGFATGRR